ncbi:hypothetical protein GCM10010129_59530 [Streptomyces fumigatiscleroticus]|nr:hypothetical protein GCM10010129_59530 [Streptomyces fumigatiscleroticus]
MAHATVPHPTPRTTVEPDRARLRPTLSCSIQVQRLPGSHDVLGTATQSILAALGTPGWLAHRMADAARIAGHYVVGHSAAPTYRLLLTADGDSVTVAATDYDDQHLVDHPAWLPVTRDNRLSPAAPPPAAHADGDALQLHRTPDGCLRLTYRTAWPVRGPGI